MGRKPAHDRRAHRHSAIAHCRVQDIRHVWWGSRMVRCIARMWPEACMVCRRDHVKGGTEDGNREPGPGPTCARRDSHLASMLPGSDTGTDQPLSVPIVTVDPDVGAPGTRHRSISGKNPTVEARRIVRLRRSTRDNSAISHRPSRLLDARYRIFRRTSPVLLRQKDPQVDADRYSTRECPGRL